jgi:hypothetical protein
MAAHAAPQDRRLTGRVFPRVPMMGIEQRAVLVVGTSWYTALWMSTAKGG